MKRIKRKHVTIFIFVFIILAVIIYLIPGVTDALRSTYVVEYGNLDITDETDGFFVRNETVYFAGKGGDENRYIGENKLIRKGTRVMSIQGSSDAGQKLKFRSIRNGIGSDGVTTDDCKAQKEGILTYSADGYETEYTPKKMKDISREKYEELKNDASVDLARSEVSKGDPIFKIVDRSAWYIVCFVPKDHKSRYQAGEKMNVLIDGKDKIIANISSISTDSENVRLILKTNYYVKNFTKTRVAEIKLTTSDASGLVLLNSSITKKGGHEGVYVKTTTGEYEFTRIQVIASDGEKSIVSKSYFFDEKGNAVNTVTTYDEVLKRA